MPAVFTSYKPEPDDDLDTRAKKLYLGIISLGEDLYTFNAAVNELRKEFVDLDGRFKELGKEYAKFREDKRECKNT